MNVKHKPATALPWEFDCEVGRSDSWICRADSGDDGDAVVARMECHSRKATSERKNAATYPVLTERSVQDAAYITHACNTYADMVNTLTSIANQTSGFGTLPGSALSEAMARLAIDTLKRIGEL